MDYFISDMHFGREHILWEVNRPFNTIEEMADAIIENCNKRLSAEDTLYILGDVSRREYIPEKEMNAIPGHKILIAGNHDRTLIEDQRFRDLFDDIKPIEYVSTPESLITLFHYPLAEWDGMMRQPVMKVDRTGRPITREHWMFYGHVHNAVGGGTRLLRYNPMTVNVGVDVNDFTPQTAVELMTKQKKEFLAAYQHFSEEEKILCHEYCPFMEKLLESDFFETAQG